MSVFKNTNAPLESLLDTTLLILSQVLQLDITPFLHISMEEPLLPHHIKESTVFQNVSLGFVDNPLLDR